ncbi:MAG: hypothetical protein GF344_19350 [Chitinivibrionales bacterium]|nr:hypothetical protein [Chitinivibrionales bacterium]MBD3358781.1 hypothetical protein [Chitinivibrionales bacterium]
MAFSCITRADKVDEELLDLMKAAGFVAIAFGLESAVASVLRNIGKVNPLHIDDQGAIRLCARGPIIGMVGDTLYTLRSNADTVLSRNGAKNGKWCSSPHKTNPQKGKRVAAAIPHLQTLSRIPFHTYDMVRMENR